ncbi:unannotated protein [freshwater metagenome]|uniref:Unannotated protein n=1 Tax=freshwater metagenome TaxID=449393 RepID=A0A6J7RV81_9ZZZZ
MRGYGAVNATAHRDQDSTRDRVELRFGGYSAAECPCQGVGCQLSGVDLAGAQPAEMLTDVARADLRGIQNGLAVDELNRGAGSRARGAAARSREGGVGNPVTLNANCDAHQITAGGAASHATVRACWHVALSARVAQVILKTLVSHRGQV